MNIEAHYLSILLSSIASMVIGFLRYSPMLFGKSWMQLVGISENGKFLDD